jgi:hypothetical protein
MSAARGAAAEHRTAREANKMRVASARAALTVDPTAAIGWLQDYPVDGEDWREVRELAMKAELAGVRRAGVRGAWRAAVSDRGDRRR